LNLAGTCICRSAVVYLQAIKPRTEFMNIALVCYKGKETFSIIENENILLLEYLQHKGLKIQKEIWDDPHVNWTQYDLAILKAPWDYFDKSEQFNQWLQHLKEVGVRLLNPVEIVRWNSDKHYLRDIAEAGLDIIPSLFLEKGQQVNWEEYFTYFKTDRLIMKPAVSGAAKNTFILNKNELTTFSGQMQSLLTDEAFLLQPFISQIQEEGEWSLVFFGGRFSHCLLKTAKTGDFRVQHVHGGSVYAKDAPEEMLRQAQNYVDTFAKDCLYARVDGVRINGTFALMELELIEPYLYLFTNEQGFENYYQALLALLQQEQKSSSLPA
jgi:glutathione synthase/RimK-type ligase-like ATP-grasp enzyme